MKYHNTKTEIDGIVFDSKKEAKTYLMLKEMEANGEITDLRLQVPFELIPPVYETVRKQLKTKTKEVKKCVQRATYYLADFVYTHVGTGKTVVVDVKSPITKKNPAYILKKKMMRAFRGISILEM